MSKALTNLSTSGIDTAGGTRDHRWVGHFRICVHYMELVVVTGLVVNRRAAFIADKGAPYMI